MPDPAFPDIPYAPIYSYEEQPEDPGIMTKMRDGSYMSGAVFSDPKLADITLPWVMSAENKAVLLNFYQRVVYGCSRIFTFVHPDPDSEFYGLTFRVRFASPPRFRKVAPGYFETTLKFIQA